MGTLYKSNQIKQNQVKYWIFEETEKPEHPEKKPLLRTSKLSPGVTLVGGERSHRSANPAALGELCATFELELFVRVKWIQHDIIRMLGNVSEVYRWNDQRRNYTCLFVLELPFADNDVLDASLVAISLLMLSVSLVQLL